MTPTCQGLTPKDVYGKITTKADIVKFLRDNRLRVIAFRVPVWPTDTFLPKAYPDEQDLWGPREVRNEKLYSPRLIVERLI